MYANPAVRVVDIADALHDESALTSLPTPTSNQSLALKRGDFETVAQGLDYAARGGALIVLKR